MGEDSRRLYFNSFGGGHLFGRKDAQVSRKIRKSIGSNLSVQSVSPKLSWRRTGWQDEEESLSAQFPKMLVLQTFKEDWQKPSLYLCLSIASKLLRQRELALKYFLKKGLGLRA